MMKHIGRPKYIDYPRDQKLRWKDFLLLIKRKYYLKEPIKNVGSILMNALSITYQMIKEDKAWFSDDDFLKLGLLKLH
jgi:hypothetical protein